jgi:RNA polymerase sigma-70 factor (ECF subfamily)
LLVFRKIQTFRGESAFPTWLHRLALNVVFMHMRKRKLPEASLETTMKLDDKSQTQRKEVGDCDLSLTGLIDRVNLERAVNQLPETCKTVFVLHDIQGYKHNEIAGIMDSSVATSKVRLHRARLRLRQLLREGKDCFSAGYSSPSQSQCPAS